MMVGEGELVYIARSSVHVGEFSVCVRIEGDSVERIFTAYR